MTEFTLFFNPMSRAQIAHWGMQEAGADFELAMVEWTDKPAALLEANPMGKIPTIIHHAPEGDRVVTEAPAICHYIAHATKSDLLPREEEVADYFRWMFFSSGPLEAAVTSKSFGWEPKDARQEGTVGFGSFDRSVNALDQWLSTHDYVCGDRFTMADVIVGSQVDWGLRFGTLPDRESFKAYQARVSEREAYKNSMGTIGA